MINVSIIPLSKEHADISFNWRNNPKVWELTGSHPDRTVTIEMERNWIVKAINNPYQKRYAILADSNYVGNVQLTDIKDESAEFHIFIGDTSYWGKGIATIATRLMLQLAFEHFALKEVYLWVNKKNLAAIKAYRKNSFLYMQETDSQIKMRILASDWEKVK